VRFLWKSARKGNKRVRAVNGPAWRVILHLPQAHLQGAAPSGFHGDWQRIFGGAVASCSQFFVIARVELWFNAADARQNFSKSKSS